MGEKRSVRAVLGEFSIIVIGVFVALAADSWYQGWSESRGLEGYLDRLIVDLEADSATFQFVLAVLDGKDAALEEVATVSLGIEEPDSAFFQSQHVAHERQLLPDTTWDVGDIRLRSGWKAIVRLRDVEDPRKARLSLRGLEGRPASSPEYEDGAWRTPPLVPGEYELCVFGDGFAASRTRFSIQKGRDTEIDLALRPGFRVPIELTVPSRDQIRSAKLFVHRDGERVIEKSIKRTEGQTCATEVYLDPGTYSVRGVVEGFEGTMQLEVKAGTDNATAKMTLRPR